MDVVEILVALLATLAALATGMAAAAAITRARGRAAVGPTRWRRHLARFAELWSRDAELRDAE